MFGGVGFRESTLSDVPSLTKENKESRSGLYFQDANGFVTLRNIYDCQENKDITEDGFNTLLGNMQKSVILESVNKVIEGESDFISSLNLYPFEKSFDTVVTKKDKFVGFYIEPKNKNVTTKINWVELSFDADTTFTLYLYNSNKPKTPIEEVEVETVAGEAKIVDLDWYISDSDEYKGGKFYIGYYYSDVDANAYKKDHDVANMRVVPPAFNVQPISLGHDGLTIDVEDETYESESYGLNIGMEIYTDYTQMVLRNQNLFWNLIKNQMAEKVLNLISTSTRTNITERANQARLELYGSEKYGIIGATAKTDRALKSLKRALFYKPRIERRTLR